MSRPPAGRRLLATVFLPFAAGYFLANLHRSIHSIIGDEVAQDLRLSASDLGLLVSAFFLAYGASQLPVGMLLDRYGPRRVQAALLLVAAAGTLTCGLAQSAVVFAVGRALIGLGVASCLIAAFQANVIWWPKARLPLLNGLVMAVGGLGAVAATTPAQQVLHVTDWRGLLIVSCLATLAVAGAVYLVVPESRPGRGGVERPSTQLSGLLIVYKDPLFWRIAPLTITTQAVYLAFQSLWAGLWLRDVGGFDGDAVAVRLLGLAAAMILGALFMGLLGDRLRRIGLGPMGIVGASTAAFLVAQIVLAAEATAVASAAWLAFGFFGMAPILSYARLTQHFAVGLAGRVNSALNVLVFAGAFGFQFAVGGVIEHWPTTGDGLYAREGYQAAFVFVLALEIPALLWFLWPAAKRRSRAGDRA